MSPEAIAAVNTVSYELETAAALRRALNTAGKDIEHAKESLRLKEAAIGALQERLEGALARIDGLERANRALINENRQLRDDCKALRATAADWQRRAQGRQLS